jgi:hypothetical protein
VIVTSWITAPIPWPRCRLVGGTGGSGLLVDEELARAVRNESSLAIQHWFGVSIRTVWCWQKAFGVTQWGTEGSRRLHQGLSAAGAEKLRGRQQTEDEKRRRLATRKRNGVRRPRPRPGGRIWSEEHLALLGALPDAEVAARIGRTETAVRVRRARLTLPTALDRRKDNGKRPNA